MGRVQTQSGVAAAVAATSWLWMLSVSSTSASSTLDKYRLLVTAITPLSLLRLTRRREGHLLTLRQLWELCFHPFKCGGGHMLSVSSPSSPSAPDPYGYLLWYPWYPPLLCLICCCTARVLAKAPCGIRIRKWIEKGSETMPTTGEPYCPARLRSLSYLQIVSAKSGCELRQELLQ